jgi:branched-chain amino acid transport system substrate-binding protein
MGNVMQLRTICRRGLVAAIAALSLSAVFAPNARAQEKPTIKLGFIGPLSGGNANEGASARNGFILAIDQANASDYPYKVEPVILDDASDPQTGVGAALKLVNDPDVVAATAHWNSSVALATIGVFNRYNVPVIIWGATSPKITDQNLPSVSRVTPNLVNDNELLVGWLHDKTKARKMAVISDTSDYGAANTQHFEDLFKGIGGQVVASEAIPVGTTDFRSILTKIKSLAPDGIYFGGVTTEAGIVRKQMVELGLNIPMYGIWGFYDPEYLTIAGSAADGTLVEYANLPENPKLKAMFDAYKDHKFAEQSGPYTQYAYEAAKILLQAIKDNGYKDKAALGKAIRAIKYDGVLGVTTFDDHGQTKVATKLDMKGVKDGKWVDLAD